MFWSLLWAGVGESLRSNGKRQDMLSEIDEDNPSSCVNPQARDARRDDSQSFLNYSRLQQ